MSITNYSELQTSVANWLHRSDLTAQIPDFIAIAESALSRDLDCKEMETKTTLTTTSGSATVALPVDLVETRRLMVTGTYNTVLKYLTPDELAQDYGDNSTGLPCVFTVIGGALELAKIPDSAYTMELTYRQQIPALSDASTTNWLLTRWPDAYLYGALLAAQPYIIGDARLPVFEKKYADAINGINGIDWYSGTTMRVKSR